VSTESLYVGGEGEAIANGATPITVLHKFALNGGDIEYRASGAAQGRIGWANASYYMDESEGDLRIVTTRHTASDMIHSLTVLREAANRNLALLSVLPNAARPAPLGKPGEQVHAVRFFGDRGYVVTARVTDPLYAIDLSDPADPFIAGELEIPGIATYLQPIGPEGAELLLSVGHELDSRGVRTSVKVELFDVSDLSHPESVAVRVFGAAGSFSDATNDPHALTLLPLPEANSYRIALPINVYETPYAWTYSGVHLLQIEDIGGPSPQLTLHGVIKTAEPGNAVSYPPYAVPNRSVIHDDSVFVVYGEAFSGAAWSEIGLP
jgi:uncharacterized secreted protein with C-terminal beta-propeller domain